MKNQKFVKKEMYMKNEIIIFENQNVKLEVNMKDETVWLTQEQMSMLFNKVKSTINEHIKNIYKEGELIESETMTKFGNPEFSGKPINYYNLDMIISVGYRVKSKQGVEFRKWATKILKDYLLKGYSINQKRLEYLEKTVKLIDIANRIEEDISGEEAKGIIQVINGYSKALYLLDDYDHKSMLKPNGTSNDKVLTYEECKDIIETLKFNNRSSLFALERNEGLKAILGAIYQSFDGEIYIQLSKKRFLIRYIWLLKIILL